MTRPSRAKTRSSIVVEAERDILIRWKVLDSSEMGGWVYPNSTMDRAEASFRRDHPGILEYQVFALHKRVSLASPAAR